MGSEGSLRPGDRRRYLRQFIAVHGDRRLSSKPVKSRNGGPLGSISDGVCCVVDGVCAEIGDRLPTRLLGLSPMVSEGHRQES
jgi:hypothetical protein